MKRFLSMIISLLKITEKLDTSIFFFSLSIFSHLPCCFHFLPCQHSLFSSLFYFNCPSFIISSPPLLYSLLLTSFRPLCIYCCPHVVSSCSYINCMSNLFAFLLLMMKQRKIMCRDC